MIYLVHFCVYSLQFFAELGPEFHKKFKSDARFPYAKKSKLNDFVIFII